MNRILTAAVLTAFALYSVFLSPAWLFPAIVFLMAGLCYYEFAGIAVANGVEGPLWLGYIAGALAIHYPAYLPLIIIVVMCVALRIPDLSKALFFSGTIALAVFYIFISWGYATPLRERSVWWLLFGLAINWVGDIAAYYVGRAIGKHKLAPRISPGKSWEGAVASMIVAVGLGIWYGMQFQLGLDWTQMALLSAVANVAGQVGDLAESALKRGASVKDSGNLLPGHGGFLDRLDSTLFTLPVVYHFLAWFAPRT